MNDLLFDGTKLLLEPILTYLSSDVFFGTDMSVHEFNLQYLFINHTFMINTTYPRAQ